MRNRNPKIYYEELAKKTLGNFVEPSFNKLILQDKPDLQSDEIDWGVEVTRCIEEKEGRFYLFVKDYFFNKKITEELIKEKIYNMKLQESWFYVSDNLRVCSYTEGLESIPTKKEFVIKCINTKNRKLQTYKKFKNNGLYLFCSYDYEESDIKEMIKKVDNICFTHLFFDCLSYIFVYEKDKEMLSKIEFNEPNYSKMLSSLKEKHGIRRKYGSS